MERPGSPRDRHKWRDRHQSPPSPASGGRKDTLLESRLICKALYGVRESPQPGDPSVPGSQHPTCRTQNRGPASAPQTLVSSSSCALWLCREANPVVEKGMGHVRSE